MKHGHFCVECNDFWDHFDELCAEECGDFSDMICFDHDETPLSWPEDEED